MSECIISASADNYTVFITDYVSHSLAWSFSIICCIITCHCISIQHHIKWHFSIKIWIFFIQAFFFRKSAHSILIIKWYKIFLCQCFSYLVTHTSTLSCNRDYHIYLFSAHAFLRITGLCQVRAGTNPACENNIFTLFS